MPSPIRRRPSAWPVHWSCRQGSGAVAALTAVSLLGWLLPAPARTQPNHPLNQSGLTAAPPSTPLQGTGLYGVPPPHNPRRSPALADQPSTDRAVQDWHQLDASIACTADSLSDLLRAGKAINRFEAAALVRRCLPQPGSETDQQRALIQAFSAELSLLGRRTDSLRGRLMDLEVLQFSSTTRLHSEATFVLGANRFDGSAATLVNSSRNAYGASTFNYDLKLILDTSFTGKDLLRIRLRAGNFNRTSNSFYGAGPSALSELEVAFQERSGADIVGLNRLYYQLPIGDFTFTLGPLVEQDTMLAIWPSVYPAASVLDVMTFAGAIGALNLNLGTGAGLWWQKDGFAISVNTIAANGYSGDPELGGIASGGSGTSSSLQIGYRGRQWALAATVSWLQNGFGTIPYGTDLVLSSFEAPGSTSAYGLSGYWQPLTPGWMPSISAGYGLNTSRYERPASTDSLITTSQSWSVGVQWRDAIAKGHDLGFAVGQPTYAIRRADGARPDDGNWVWEGWYNITLSDHLSLTPAVFYLSRPLGAETPAGRSFQQLGALIKTSLRF